MLKYLVVGCSEGLDFGGNDLCDNIDFIVDCFKGVNMLWVFGLVGCNFDLLLLCKILLIVFMIEEFCFIDLLWNNDFFIFIFSVVGML